MLDYKCESALIFSAHDRLGMHTRDDIEGLIFGGLALIGIDTLQGYVAVNAGYDPCPCLSCAEALRQPD